MDISKQLLPYVAIADMIGDSFGNKCEAVIHDLSKPENSVVYVANGIITKREVGQSFDHLVKQVILSKNFKNDYRSNYTFTANGKEIKSSTALIRDEHEDVIGAFCLNFEVEDFRNIASFLNVFFTENDKDESNSEEQQAIEYGTVEEIINNLIDNTIGTVDVTRLKKKDNIRLITFMLEKGIFLAKGSVEKVAEKLKISPVTVYAYLDKIKKDAKKAT